MTIPDVRPSELVEQVREKIAERREVEAILRDRARMGEGRLRLRRE